MNVLAVVLAGGKGERLYPLTRDRAKPGVPFGGCYRIIDFTLSNCANSGVRNIVILTQYKSFSLDRHIQLGWNFFSHELNEYVYIIPAQQRVSEEWYLGTADAVYQNIYTLEQARPRLTLILSGDHVYSMDYRGMIGFHQLAGADLTVAAIPMPKETSRMFGVMVVDKNYRIIGFQEKPKNPDSIPGKPDMILASMGIYVFNTDVLVRGVTDDAKDRNSSHDFGKDIIPSMIGEKKVFAYPFIDEKNGAPGYWRDVGTVEAYWEAHMDLISRNSEFSLMNRDWPIYTYEPPTPPAKIVSTGMQGEGMKNCIIAGGSFIAGSRVANSVVGRNVTIKEGAIVEESIIMDRVTVGTDARLKRVIVDKNVIIPPETIIDPEIITGVSPYDTRPSGITIIPKGMRFD
ncbi:MAG: glucose-1-phosphate adenylyltransferase [Deltaproteobacteria bacterium]|nr:glucose-1-phosphate adenylyltransferase [Candidatus Zymogenaceae bacterium]